jgi:DNA processing protein
MGLDLEGHPMKTLTPEQLLGPLNAVEAKNAPRQIHFEGDLGLLRRHRVAIVGSRAASDEATRRAARLARELSRAGVVIVSGLAEGIDASAHRAAMAEGGGTIAVLGNGLSHFFPQENRDLQAEIARDHLLLSEFAEGTPPKAGNFPARNRTMALVSQATVIVDAQERSGTVSQAWEAIRLGRQLFLMRSLVEKPGLEWPKLVMQYGADILDSSEQLVSFLPPLEEFELDAAAF